MMPFAASAAGLVASVEYAHEYLRHRHDITIAANAHPKQIINVHYLLYLVDRANDGRTSYYAGPFSTKQIATDVAVRDAIDRLVVIPEKCPLPDPWVPGACWGNIVGQGNFSWGNNAFFDAFLSEFWTPPRDTKLPDDFMNCVYGYQPNSFLSGMFGNSDLTELPECFLAHITGCPWTLLNATFSSSKLESIPNNFMPAMTEMIDARDNFNTTFAGTQIQSTGDNFLANLERIQGWSSSSGGSHFYATFGWTSRLSSIGKNFMGKLRTIDSSYRDFQRMFSQTSALKTLPNDFFKSLESINNSEMMFDYMFTNSGLETLPDNLFPKLEEMNGGRNNFAGAFSNSKLTLVGKNFMPSLRVVTNNDFFMRMMFEGLDSPSVSIGSGFMKNLRQITGSSYFMNNMFSWYSGGVVLQDDFLENIENVMGSANLMDSTFAGTNMTRTPNNFLPKVGGDVAPGFFSGTFGNISNLETVSLGSYFVSAPSGTDVMNGTFSKSGNGSLKIWLWYNTALVPVINEMWNWLPGWSDYTIDYIGSMGLSADRVESIHVPANLLDAYKNNPNWEAVADKFVAIRCSDILGAPANGVPHRALAELQTVVGDVGGAKWAQVVAGGYCE